jgi:hypothetical protein
MKYYFEYLTVIDLIAKLAAAAAGLRSLAAAAADFVNSAIVGVGFAVIEIVAIVKVFVHL